MNKFILVLSVFIIGCGTLGSFKIINFYTTKTKLTVAVDSIFSLYPKYKVPEKWKKFDDWAERGYSFLDSRLFYFKEPPEEMYYVTINYDTTDYSKKEQISLAIRAVCEGNPRWLLSKDINENELERIENRFNEEIINKISTMIH